MLNNFATAVRVLQARGIDAVARAREVAKLTVLQTEFPAVAADLLLLPSLLRLLLEDDPEGEISPQAQRLVDRYRDVTDVELELGAATSADPADGADEAEESEETAAGPLLGAPPAVADDKRARRAAQARLNTQLAMYLRRADAAQIPDPFPDLLYLRGAAADEGLESVELNAALDMAAENAPDDTVAAFADATQEQVTVAVRALARRSDGEIRPGRTFLVEAACRLATQLETGSLTPFAASIAPSVTVVTRDPTSSPRLLPGALAIAVAAGNAALAREVVDRMRAQPEARTLALPQVTGMLPLLDDVQRNNVQIMVADTYPSQPDVLLNALRDLPRSDAERLWQASSRQVSRALANAGTAASVTSGTPVTPAPDPSLHELLSGLLGIVDQREEPAPAIAAGVLVHAVTAADDDESRALLSGGADSILPTLPSMLRAEVVLAAVTRSRASDVPGWVALLDDDDDLSSLAEAALTAAADVVATIGEADIEAAVELPRHVQRLLRDVPASEARDTLIGAAKVALQALAWPGTDSEQARRDALYAALTQPAVGAGGPRAVAQDLSESIVEKVHAEALVIYWVRCLRALPAEVARDVDASLPEQPRSEELASCLRLRLAARGVYGGPPPALDALTAVPETGRQELLEQWLTLNPSTAAFLDAGSTYGWPRPGAVGQYAARLTDVGRAALWVDLHTAGAPSAVLDAVAARGLNVTAVRVAAEATRGAATQPERAGVVDRLLAARLDSAAAQGTAHDLAHWLLTNGGKTDVPVAGRLIAHVGRPSGQRATALRSALTAALANGANLPVGVQQQLADLGVASAPKKKNALQKLLDSF